MLADHIHMHATGSDAVNRGFSKQSFAYDEADRANVILQDLRHQVYRHVEKFLKPESHMLELNAGTGIDALYFALQGHYVHATDLSDGMIAGIKRKIASHPVPDHLTCQQISFEHLDNVIEKKFDYVFSNFGGLNCVDDLKKVTRHLPALVKPGGYITWVIMPPVCLWELLWALKGKWRQAFRRLKRDGVMAHVEGEYFKTFYHSLSRIRHAFGDSFELVRSEGLAALSPPPHCGYVPPKYSRFYRAARKIDSLCRDFFPFNRWADHLIVTFRYNP